MTTTYQELRTSADNSGITQNNDCTIIAVALMANVRYEVAASVLRKAGKRDNKGASIFVMREAFELLGYEMYDVTDEAMYSNLNFQTHECLNRRSWYDYDSYYTNDRSTHLRMYRQPETAEGGYLDQLEKIYGVKRKFATPKLTNKFPKVKWYEGKELWQMNGHVAVVDNGVVQDWTNNRSHRVRRVYRIRKIES